MLSGMSSDKISNFGLLIDLLEVIIGYTPKRGGCKCFNIINRGRLCKKRIIAAYKFVGESKIKGQIIFFFWYIKTDNAFLYKGKMVFCFACF